MGFHLQLAVGPFLLGHEHALAQLLGEVKFRLAGEDGLGLDAGEQQHVGGQIGQPVGLAADDGEVLPPLFRRQLLAAFQQQVGKAPQRGDGGFEPVGKVVDEILAQDLGVAQLLGGGVEGGGELPQFQCDGGCVASGAGPFSR